MRDGELLRLLVENVRDHAIFVDDPDGTVRTWTEGAERLLGYREGEIVGRTLNLLVTPEDVRDGVVRRESEVTRDESRSEREGWLIREDGTRIRVREVTTPLVDDFGAIRGFARVIQDCSGWWNADRGRRAIEERDRVGPPSDDLGTAMEVAEATIARLTRLAEYLRDVSLTLTESPSLREMLDRCVRMTVEYLDGAFAWIWTLDKSGEVLELQAGAGLSTHIDEPRRRVPVGQFEIGKIAQSREPYLTNSVIGDPLVPGQDWAKREGMVAFAGYPLVVEDRLVGVLAMFARHPLSEATLRAMASVADGIALGIERRIVEEALRREREWLKVTLASIGDALIATDTQGRVTFLNGVAEALTGWSHEEAVGRPMEDIFRIVNEQTRRSVEHPVGRVLREGTVVGLANHTVLISRDGTETAIEDSAAPIRDDQGRTIGVVMVFRDASEERRHQAELRESEERFRQMAESIPQLAWMARPDGHIFWYNRRWYDYTGTTFAQMEGWDWRSVHDPAALPAVEARWRGAIVRGEPFDMVFPLRGADGAFRPFLTRVMPLKDDRGEVIRWFGTNTDISEERRLHQEREMFATLVENSGDFIGVFGLDGAPIFLNEAGMRLVGLEDKAQMLRTNLREYFHPENRDFVLDQFLPGVIRDGRGEVEIRFRHFRTGEPIWMIYSVFLLRGPDGEPSGYASVSRDITERKRVEDEVRAAKQEAVSANKAKDHFLAILSHELRTPLNPILLATTSMLEATTDPDEVRSTLKMIRQNVLLQSRLIDDLLDVMRIVRGKMPLHWEVADGHRLIQQSQQICQSEVFGKGLRLELDFAARDHHINADPARLQQVFWNLIKNAVKFTPGGGTITIRTRNEASEAGDLLIVEIGDTGIGIEPAVLPLIFDPFQQGETVITRKFGGLGLGLAICKGVIESHGGTITVRSDGAERGTTFQVTLKTLPEPVAEVVAEPVGSEPTETPSAPSSLRMLVVEDEPATLRLMARLLRRLGHTVTTAGSIASAFDAYQAGEFDLIISDIGLPDGTGLDLIRRVVALQTSIPAIALTGYGMEEDIVRSRAAGFTAHMTKPIDFPKLEAMIRQVAPTSG